MYVLAFLLSSHQDEGCRSVKAEQSQDRLNEWQWATAEETWTVSTNWETSDVGKIGTFQYLKGNHENETELFFVTVGLGSGKTRAHHFILALEQTAFGGSELSTTGEISQKSLAGSLQNWEETHGLDWEVVQDQAMACGPNLFHHLFLYRLWNMNNFCILKWFFKKEE